MSNKIPCGGFYLDDMLNVNDNGELSINGGTPYQQLVTDGDGNTKWEDRLAYSDSRVVANIFEDRDDEFQIVRVFDEVPSFVFDGASVKVWFSNGNTVTMSVEQLADELLAADGADAFFALSDNVVLNIDIDIGAKYVFPKKGVYFGKYVNRYTAGLSIADSDTPEITWDGNIEMVKTVDQKYIPSELNEIILPSSSPSSTKKFKITVNDNGTITATEVT